VKHVSHNAISRKLSPVMLNQGDADMVKQDDGSMGILIAGRHYLSQHQLNDRGIRGREKFVVSAGCCFYEWNSSISDLFKKKESSSDKSFFELKAPSKQVIGKSPFYATSASMDKKGIESVKKNGATTVIDD
jgi:uncharacterized protein YegP (UPF0339 family)